MYILWQGYIVPCPFWLHKVHFVTGFTIPLPILVAQSPFCDRDYYSPAHSGCTKFPGHKVHFVTGFTGTLPTLLAQSGLGGTKWVLGYTKCFSWVHKVNFVQIAIVFKECLCAQSNFVHRTQTLCTNFVVIDSASKSFQSSQRKNSTIYKSVACSVSVLFLSKKFSY